MNQIFKHIIKPLVLSVLFTLCFTTKSAAQYTFNTTYDYVVQNQPYTYTLQGDFSNVLTTNWLGGDFVQPDSSGVLGPIDYTVNWIGEYYGYFTVEVVDYNYNSYYTDVTAELISTTWYQDSDGDGLGDPAVSITQVSQPTGYVSNSNDQCPTQSGASANNGCPITGSFSDENYIHTTSPREATTNIASLNDTQKIENITYFDGLGRPMQNIGIRAGGNSEDIVTHIDYDDFGRQDKEYLPYTASTNGGLYRTDGLAVTNTYYDASVYEPDFPSVLVNDINAYSQKEFEASPLNRLLKQAAPGKDWKLGNGHEIEFDYQSNSGSEVRHYNVNITESTSNNIKVYTTILASSSSNNGYYPAGELYKTITKDENHDGTSSKLHTTEEFKDKQGHVVLKRTYAIVSSSETAHDTYYVYDDYGNLSYVLPPKVVHDSHISSTELSELCYQYRYDNRNRLVEKKIPGKGWEYIVYNKLDLPVFTQDASLNTQNKWLFTKYDAFGRVAFTGIANSSSSRTELQNSANNTTTYTQFVTKTSSPQTIAGTTVYYTNTAIPHGVDEILTINYYDDYTFDLDGATSETAYGITPETNVKGLATGSKVRVLGTNDWITNVTYYDEKSRPIYVYSFNDYLDTTDKVKSNIDFAGQVLETTATHAKTGNTTITTVDAFEYDHVGRLISQTQKINDQNPTQIVKNNYDDLGQLESKEVGNVGLNAGYKDLVGVTVSGDEITKTSEPAWQAGLATNGSFTGDGYIEYQVPQLSRFMVGLSTDNTDANFATIDYAIYTHHSGDLRIYESGSFKGTLGSYQAGDTFRVERIGSTINYLKNGVIFYTSLTPSSGSLLGDISMYYNGDVIKGLTLETSSSQPSLQTIDYTYNVRGWLKQINDPANLGTDLFGFKINYNTNDHGGNNLFNGNIAETEWKTANTDNSLKWYKYGYDALNRITYAINDNGRYNLASSTSPITYDKNGNITFLTRKGHIVENPDAANSSDFGDMDRLYYYFETNSNKIRKVADFKNDDFGFVDDNSSGDDYIYDDNGNMIQDLNKGITNISYNHLNLPTNVSINGNGNVGSISYIYDATGIKQKKIISTGATTEYVGNYVYENGSLKFFNHAEGYVEPKDENNLALGFNYIYQYKDHLGNVRLSYKDNNGTLEILEENNYYPFGLKHKGYNTVVNSTNPALKYKFGGKEYQDELDLAWYDVTARNYDPALGRWMNIDPAADVLESSSQYVYALNSPIVYIDEDGELPILINGRVSSNDERGSSKYWDSEIIATIKGSGIANPGGQFHYVDGDRGEITVGTPKERRYGKGRKEVTENGSFTSSARRNAGERIAESDFETILSKLEKDPETGKIIEKIQIYTHSRGAAFGEGYTKQLLKMIKENSHLFADANNVIEYSLNLAPHQSNSVNAVDGVETFGISHTSDILSGNDIEGADNVHSNPGNVITSHKNGKFNKELKAFLSAVSSSGGPNKAAIEKFKKSLEDLGIKFTYKEK